MRFLVDENLPAEIAVLLQGLGYDTFYVPGTDLHKAPDSQLIEHASQEHRVIVTKDVNLAIRSGHLTPGVVLIQVPAWFRKVEIVEAFANFTRHPRFAESKTG